MKPAYFLFLIVFIFIFNYSSSVFSCPIAIEFSEVWGVVGRRCLPVIFRTGKTIYRAYSTHSRGWENPDQVRPLQHKTALPSHYDESASTYDAFNETNSVVMNNRIAALLKSYSPSCKSILDVTCGTGAQVFYLATKGYEVAGSDINERMLQVARQKAKESFPNLVNKLHHADMRSVRLGQYDAVISMFNAVGHLTREDFELAMRNIRSNLNVGGLYIFDIFNFDYLRNGSNISKLTIDWVRQKNNETIREIQYSDIDIDGILTSYTLLYKTNPRGHHTVSRSVQTLQVYAAEELVDILSRAGFRVLQQCGIDGEKVSKIDTERLFTTAKLLD